MRIQKKGNIMATIGLDKLYYASISEDPVRTTYLVTPW